MSLLLEPQLLSLSV